MINTKRNPADIALRGVKPAEMLPNRLWFSGPEFLTLDKDSWTSLKVGEKFILLSEIESRANNVCMFDVLCKESENDICMCDAIDRENRNNSLCAVAINTEAKIENNLQLEWFSSLVKCLELQHLIISL